DPDRPAARRWRHGGKRLDDAVSRRHSAGDDRVPGLARDHRLGRGLCCRLCPRPLSRAGRDDRTLVGRSPLHAADAGSRARGALRRLAPRRRRDAVARPEMNILSELPDARSAEIVETLLAAPGVRIERIVSFGQASPDGFWYDQAEAEWVLLLA